MSITSAILNSALPYLTTGVGSGFKLSITHFSLAWVSEEERAANPISRSMTELVRQSPADGIVRGDYIYNIWQTPFSYDKYAGQFPAPNKVSTDLERGFGHYYQYEYNEQLKCNVLQPNQITGVDSLPDDARMFFRSFTGHITPYYGYVSSSGVSGQLTSSNIPPPLVYSITNQSTIPGLGEYTKYFPIKSFRPISQLDSNSSTVMNYNMVLPPISVNYGDVPDFYAKSIGNFKFNRIGLYMTVCAERDDYRDTTDPKDKYEPMASMHSIFDAGESYPILFAVMDIGLSSDSCSGASSAIEIYKTRDDRGFAGWDFDAQFTISSSVLEADEGFYTLYVDAIRDDATKYYQAQIMNNASISQTVMQLQMMVLQLADRLERGGAGNQTSQYNCYGYDVYDKLMLDTEYVISRDTANKKMLLDASGFRGIDSRSIKYVNSANALFSFKTRQDSNESLSGEFIKITLYNLDGRHYSTDNGSMSWWNGAIMFTNYDESTNSKTRIFEIDSNLIKGIAFAKVTLVFSYVDTVGWVLEQCSVIDESRLFEV